MNIERNIDFPDIITEPRSSSCVAARPSWAVMCYGANKGILKEFGTILVATAVVLNAMVLSRNDGWNHKRRSYWAVVIGILFLPSLINLTHCGDSARK